jgi:hypothetical protein
VITFDRVGNCGNFVTMLIEGYSPKDGRAHGSLDVTIRSCRECHQTYRDQLEACGMTPYSYTGSVSHTERKGRMVPLLCGDLTTFAENAYTNAVLASRQRR